MAEIINLREFRETQVVQAGFALWRTRFRDVLDRHTRLLDLSHRTLQRLAEPGEESTNLVNSMIIGFMGYGRNDCFHALPKQSQTRIIDIQLFLSDQIRFEMMFRLGWLERFVGNQHALFEMVREFAKVHAACQKNPPLLASSHPQYEAYAALIDRDQQVFIRRMLISALGDFEKVFGQDK